jgi:hypothetical protein
VSGSAHRCAKGTGVLIEGIAGGDGVLIWTRSATPQNPASSAPSRRYRILTRGDSTTPEGAMVAVRFMIGDVARGFAVDSGEVTLSASRDRVSATVRGSGLDYSAGQRLALEARAEAVPLASDTADCRVSL